MYFAPLTVKTRFRLARLAAQRACRDTWNIGGTCSACARAYAGTWMRSLLQTRRL
jgi:hypothetical protein